MKILAALTETLQTLVHTRDAGDVIANRFGAHR